MTEDKNYEALRRFDLLDAPGHLLRRNHQRSYEIFARCVGDDLTRQQVAILVTLAKQPGASQRGLVEATGIDKSTAREMIDRMVARGWIERSRDPDDSRAWAMRLTPACASMLSERLPDIVAAQNEILAPLAPNDRKVFLKYLRILIGAD